MSRILRRVKRGLGKTFDVAPNAVQAVWLSLGLWSIAAVMIYVPAFLTGANHGLDILQALLNVSFAVLLCVGVYRIFGWAVGRPNWLAYCAIALAGGVAPLLQSLFDIGLYELFNAIDPEVGFVPRSLRTYVSIYAIYVCLYLSTIVLFLASFALRSMRAQRVRLVQQQAELARAEARQLRVQLNPHFMFNALNAISSLIMSGDPDRARLVTENLSDFLRASLDLDANAEIPLGEEVAVLDAYLTVENARFGERLKLDIHIDPALDRALVPSLILQPLVENAMKYAVAPSLAPVTVSIRATRDEGGLKLAVADNGQGHPGVGPGSGIGLSATRDRLKAHYGDRASMEAGATATGFAAEIRLPLRMEDASLPSG